MLKSEIKNILAINTIAGRGGAARAAYDMLLLNLRDRGYNVKMFCSENKVNDNDIFLLKKNDKISNLFNFFGYLDCNHNNSEVLRSKYFKEANLIHLHNLHGGYFNPIFLPELSFLKPTIWTLHDEQSFTGHCAYAFSCEKWRDGCKNCSDLNYYPAVGLDKTNYLWNLKKEIYEKSNLTIVTPSLWLKKRVELSILGNKNIKCIYNGIDEKIWRPFNKKQCRASLGLPQDKKILLFLANGSIYNPQKGGEFVLRAIEYFKSRDDVIFLIVGSEVSINNKNVVSKGYISDNKMLATYYSSADMLIFPTLADNLPFVVMEAMACETPVISFNIGGLPEQIEHMKSGYLAKYKDFNDFIYGINTFLEDDNLRFIASKNARKQFLEKFTLNKCIDNYLDLYKETLANKSNDNKYDDLRDFRDKKVKECRIALFKSVLREFVIKKMQSRILLKALSSLTQSRLRQPLRKVYYFFKKK